MEKSVKSKESRITRSVLPAPHSLSLHGCWAVLKLGYVQVGALLCDRNTRVYIGFTVNITRITGACCSMTLILSAICLPWLSGYKQTSAGAQNTAEFGGVDACLPLVRMGWDVKSRKHTSPYELIQYYMDPSPQTPRIHYMSTVERKMGRI